jgi:hypothetical protein
MSGSFLHLILTRFREQMFLMRTGSWRREPGSKIGTASLAGED